MAMGGDDLKSNGAASGPRCPVCGAIIPPGASGGLCTRCVFAGMLEGDPPLTTPTVEQPVPTQLGNYRLLEEIGSGGFGIVYAAEQLEPIRRRVAIKVIKAGMDTRQVVARFEAERQALAMMDHPHIARVFGRGGNRLWASVLRNGVGSREFADAVLRRTSAGHS
jgi:serine/threonine protein kinase